MASDGAGGIDRRAFLVALSSGVGLLAAACRQDRLDVEVMELQRFGAPPQPVVSCDADGIVDAREGRVVTATWTPLPGVVYDVELNGIVLANEVADGAMRLEFGDQATGFVAGRNLLRVLARTDDDAAASEPLVLSVRPVGTMRHRAFDLEARAPILTTAPTLGSEIVVSDLAAHGAGRGASLRADGTGDGRAYKNLIHLPVPESWIRMSVQPIDAEPAVRRVGLGRIRATAANASENLMWVPGAGIRTSHMSQYVRTPPGVWTQVQLGIRADGTVELWTFDGRREFLVATTRRAAFDGTPRDAAAIGNVFKVDGRFEIWLDDVEVATSRIPWAMPSPDRAVKRPQRVDPAALAGTFSFVFGSCINANHVPYETTALAAAAAMQPDFFVHLGDHGYVDNSAWSQSIEGYHAFWNDLASVDHLAGLAGVPWVFICSDHDLGANNATAETLVPFASEAFATWQNNDPAADGIGRYGSVELDGGRILLVWLEGIAYRCALGVDGTMLGDAQRDWLVSLLSSTTAGLVLIATQTAVGHASDTAWNMNPTERSIVLDAARACSATVRFLSGDYHAARWADLGGDVAEWGAAPLAEFPQPPPAPTKDVVDHGWFTVGSFDSRPAALAGMTIEEFNSAGTFGRAVIDTATQRATFELRDNQGNIRADHLGRPMTETVTYGR
jgi:hypothetical protein